MVPPFGAPCCRIQSRTSESPIPAPMGFIRYLNPLYKLFNTGQKQSRWRLGGGGGDGMRECLRWMVLVECLSVYLIWLWWGGAQLECPTRKSDTRLLSLKHCSFLRWRLPEHTVSALIFSGSTGFCLTGPAGRLHSLFIRTVKVDESDCASTLKGFIRPHSVSLLSQNIILSTTAMTITKCHLRALRWHHHNSQLHSSL